MTSYIVPAHFHRLLETDPKEICRRPWCIYDSDSGIFSLTIWDVTYTIDPKAERIFADSDQTPLHDFCEIFILHYLLNTKEIKPVGEWISEKDMKGGPTFFRGPHAIPTNRIAARFGNSLDAFKLECDNLSGSPVIMADSAFRFSVLPDIPVAVLYWTGDEDFPAEAKILYDRSLSDVFVLDVVFALAITVCSRLAGRITV